MSDTTTIQAVPIEVANALVSSGVWQDGSPVPLERLSLIKMHYISFDGEDCHDGEMIALDVLSEPIANIFAQLFKRQFPISKIRGLHEYFGDDELSMEDNNTSCYCFRPISGTTSTSVHSYGAALDINPLQNPYLTIDEDRGVMKSHPKDGWKYVNRHNNKVGMVEDIVPLLAENGFFEWGGRWTTPIDYHHFQTPRWLAELLLAVNQDDAKQLLNMAIEHRDDFNKTLSADRLEGVMNLYRQHKTTFFDKWIAYLVSP